MTNYNGWTNYATWRVNLEIFDGIDVEDMNWSKLDLYDMAQAMKDYANEIIEMDVKEGLALDYARAFVSEVNWYDIAKHYVVEERPFHVIGIDENDGNATILEQFDNSGEAREWMQRYISKENAGNWKHIEVIDTRDECAETLWRWLQEDVA